MKEIGTLEKLNVKPGDVVKMVSGSGSLGYGLILTIDENGEARHTNGLRFSPKRDYEYGRSYKIISRAPPKPWKDLSPEEKGALLLARHEGKAIQFYTKNGIWSACNSPIWDDDCAYRIKPKPKVEQKTLLGWIVGGDGCFTPEGSESMDTYKITFNLIDGVPDCSSVRMEKI